MTKQSNNDAQTLLEYLDSRITLAKKMQREAKKQNTPLVFTIYQDVEKELQAVKQKVNEIIEQADMIRLVEVSCDPNDMRDKILYLLGQPRRLEPVA